MPVKVRRRRRSTLDPQSWVCAIVLKLPKIVSPPAIGFPPWDLDAILAYARALQGANDSERISLLQGRHIALLCGAGDSLDATLFVDAATGLGAMVAQIGTGPWAACRTEEIQQLGVILGRLYVAAECQGMQQSTLQKIASTSGIPVFDHIAAADHPTAALVKLLDNEASGTEGRRLVLQAVLLYTIR